MLLNDSSKDIYKVVVSSIKNDLAGSNEINQSLALAMIGSLAPEDLVFALERDIMAIAFCETNKNSHFVKKKAILCILRILRKYPERYKTENWVQPITNMFDTSSQRGFIIHHSY